MRGGARRYDSLVLGFAACTGLLSRQHSSGGKDKLSAALASKVVVTRPVHSGALAVIRYAKIHRRCTSKTQCAALACEEPDDNLN